MQAAADRPALSATHPSSSPSTASRHINQNPKTHLLLSFPLPRPGPRSDLRRRRHAEALPPCGNHPFILVTLLLPPPKGALFVIRRASEVLFFLCFRARRRRGMPRSTSRGPRRSTTCKSALQFSGLLPSSDQFCLLPGRHLGAATA